MRQDKHRAVHSQVFTMLLLDFDSLVIRFLERIKPVVVDSGQISGPKDLYFGANFRDASYHVLLLLLRHFPPRLIESLAGYTGLNQVGLACLFGVEEDGGNVEAELLSGR